MKKSVLTKQVILTKQGVSKSCNALNPAIIDEIIRRNSEGEYINKICADLGVSRNTLYSFCKRRGRPLRATNSKRKPDKFPEKTRALIANEYKLGSSSTEIAKKYKCTHHCVLRCVRDYGISIRNYCDRRKINGDPRINAVISAYRGSKAAEKYGFSLTYDEVADLCKAPCYYCGAAPFGVSKSHKMRPLKRSGIDRIDSKGGYHSFNVVPACRRCNSAKNDMSANEFADWIGKLIDNHAINKIENLIGMLS